MDISEHETEWLIDKGATMLQSLGIQEGHSVLEFGCGIGRYTIPLSQVIGEKGRLVAVEREAEELDVLRERMDLFCERPSVDVLNSDDIQLLSVGDQSMDAVLAFDVLQYIDELELFFKAVHRVLKPGGRIHVYPAKVPHPGAVDMERVGSIINKLGGDGASGRSFGMMHNKDRVDDEVYTFTLSK